jgi:ATP-dependent RNA helicase RhlE
MAGAQTGTGKTAAFTLPTLQRLKPHASTSVSPARHPVRALILTPTRELAAQVYESVRDYSKHIPLRSACVYGGVNIDPQIAELRAGIEILVATPGRLLDHVHQRTVSLGQVEIFILDEADRMLDMGFMPDIKRIAALIARQAAEPDVLGDFSR